MAIKHWIICLFSLNINAFSLEKIGWQIIQDLVPKNVLVNYFKIKKCKLSAEELRKILSVDTLAEDERLLYEKIVRSFSQKLALKNFDEKFLAQLLNEKMQLLKAVEDVSGKPREQILLQLIAQNLYRFSILQDQEVRAAVKQLERKNLRLLINVIKYFYEEIPLPRTSIDQNKFAQNYKKLIDDSVMHEAIVQIKNSKLNEQEKEIKFYKLIQVIELEAVNSASTILWDRWKQELYSQSIFWVRALEDRTTFAQEKQNKLQNGTYRMFLQHAEKNYAKELKKYVLIERGDHLLKKYNEDVKERIELTIQMLKKNSSVMPSMSLSGLELMKFQWEDMAKWQGFEEIYDELDDSENRWKKLKLKYHPDKNNNESAPEKFRQVIEAEEIYNKLMKNRFFLEKNEEVTKEHLKAQWEYERLGDGQRRMIDIYSEMLTILDKKFHKDPKCDEWVKERQIIIQCIEKGLPILNPKLPTSMLSFEIYRSEIAESFDRLMALAFVYTTALPLSKMIEAPKMSTNLGRVGFGTILQTVQQEIKAGLNNTKPKKEEIEPVLQKMFAGDYDPKIRTTFTELNHIAHNVNKSYEMEATTEDKRDKIRKKGIMLAAALQKKSEEQQKFVKNIALTEISNIIQKINKK